jgi:hypothetical protein
VGDDACRRAACTLASTMAAFMSFRVRVSIGRASCEEEKKKDAYSSMILTGGKG